MSKHRTHEDRATGYFREEGIGVERLAKQLGHEVTTGDWLAQIRSHIPDDTPIRFLGRPVIGSEVIVEKLKSEFPDVSLVTAADQLSFALMHRRMLCRKRKADEILVNLKQKVHYNSSEPIEVYTKPFKVRRQVKTGEWAVRIPLINDGRLESELDTVTGQLVARGMQPSQQPIAIRIAEVTSREKAQVIAEMAWQQVGDVVTLGSPDILTVDRI